ncbi:DUF2059 domain-containing protein [Pacificoceanicola onchidii]|uniref:DUF2059 domain-containing protein n=1 Tax=Pacificoceanicola onchidii TaxID=2562685 RepID=UPI0010A5C266|nr:DUF2059 domain-containing protein [Pacificoceanicola onchidii]
MRPIRQSLMSSLAAICLAGGAWAAPVDDLMRAVQIDEMIEIMRDEGLTYGEELAFDMFGGPGGAGWQATLKRIYDAEKMSALVRSTFIASFASTDAQPLVAFFESDKGVRIVGLELEARRAMVDDDVEAAARASFAELDGSDDPRLAQVQTFITANDLIEANVTGAMNASFQFYRGLVEGGAFAMTEQDILADVWSQEAETRVDTREWLFAFMLLAYGPLEDGTMDAYIALSESPEGRALNRALFAGFNTMYDEVSYALGLAVAQQMRGEDL